MGADAEGEMSIDAMKQALEALEDVPYMSNKDDYERFEKAQAALRLAIEQAEKQEPVAWFWFDERDGGEWIHIADSQINANKFGNAKVIPLYTAPPQRQPLTEEELRQCFLATNTAEPLAEGWPGLERFARAIERAHGIGGGE